MKNAKTPIEEKIEIVHDKSPLYTDKIPAPRGIEAGTDL